MYKHSGLKVQVNIKVNKCIDCNAHHHKYTLNVVIQVNTFNSIDSITLVNFIIESLSVYTGKSYTSLSVCITGKLLYIIIIIHMNSANTALFIH